MHSKANPYETPLAKSVMARSTRSFAVNALLLGLYCYPLIAVLSIYICWMIGWAMLGHPPVPMRNDPKFIGGAMNGAYFCTALVWMATPFIAPAGLAAAWFCPIAPNRRSNTIIAYSIAGYVALYIVAYFVLLIDPLSVFEWYCD